MQFLLTIIIQNLLYLTSRLDIITVMLSCTVLHYVVKLTLNLGFFCRGFRPSVPLLLFDGDDLYSPART